MAKSKLISHYEALIADFQKHFSNTLKRQDMEDIHQLRVSLKKIFALLHLMEMTNENQFDRKAHVDLFSNIFKKAGQLREIQVNLTLIEKYDTAALQTFRNELIKNTEQKSPTLINALQSFDQKTLNKLNALIAELFKTISEEQVIQKAELFISKKLKKVDRLKKQADNNKQFHQIRIQLKATSEMLNLLNELQAENPLQEIQQAVLSLNKKIGTWHDYVMLQTALKRFIKNHPGDNNSKQLKKLIRDIQQKNEKRQKKIVTLLDRNTIRSSLRDLTAVLS